MDTSDWDLLIQLFAQIEDKKRVDQLLNLFLTITEREFLLDRFNIVKELLTSNCTQRELAKQLGVSIAKITVGSNELKKTDPDLKEYIIQKLKKVT